MSINSTKMTGYYVLLALLAMCLPYALGQDSLPDFCKGLDCPKFTVIDSNEDFEERIYESSTWVSTVVEGRIYEVATGTGFDRLFDYISGNNANNAKIDMTAPVATRVVDNSVGPMRMTSFTVSFFMPFDLQSDPPTPNNPEVFFMTLPPHRAYVRTFDGFASGPDYKYHAAMLAQSLDRLHSYDRSFYYTAGYDSPFTYTDRRNEVWFIADN